MLLFWHLELGDGSWIFGKSVDPPLYMPLMHSDYSENNLTFRPITTVNVA
jgi:hypothetical protein